MPALRNSDVVKLVGFNSNAVFTNLLFNNSFSTDIKLLTPTSRIVAAITGAVVTIGGGDTTPFTINDFVSFSDPIDSGAYQIVSVNPLLNQITLAKAPSTRVQGDAINVSWDLTGATYEFKVRQFTATVTNAKGILSLGDDFTLKIPIVSLDLSTSVVVINAMQGWIRINLPRGTFTADPSPAAALENMPSIYAGAITFVIPTPAGADPIQNPVSAKSQRVAFLIDSNLGE